MDRPRQSLPRTWAECVVALKGLSDEVEDLARRVAAIGLTGQGDGTWLVGKDNEDVTDAWIWLDARAAPTVARLKGGQADRVRFEHTGTGLKHLPAGLPAGAYGLSSAGPARAGRSGPSLQGLAVSQPHRRAGPQTLRKPVSPLATFATAAIATAFCRLWGCKCIDICSPPFLTAPSRPCRFAQAQQKQTGLLEGTPVSLGFVDMVMTTLGAGVHTGEPGVACSAIGSTGVHMRAVRSGAVHLNEERSGYVICLPAENMVTQVQTNMSATLNIDWVLSLAGDLLAAEGYNVCHADLVKRIDGWMAASKPGALLYHPYISESGERGPFVDAKARASLIGVHFGHRYPDIVRAVVESLGMAARDCYSAMGEMPRELRLTGGAARSSVLRDVLAASLNVPVSVSSREEAGAAGCAMMAAVAIGVYPDMEACIAEWTTPLLGEKQPPNPDLVPVYDAAFQSYQQSRKALAPIWQGL